MSVAKPHWGLIVRELREQQGLSQREFAMTSAMNRNVLRRFEESGSIAPDILEKLMEVLGYELTCLRISDGQQYSEGRQR